MSGDCRNGKLFVRFEQYASGQGRQSFLSHRGSRLRFLQHNRRNDHALCFIKIGCLSVVPARYGFHHYTFSDVGRLGDQKSGRQVKFARLA